MKKIIYNNLKRNQIVCIKDYDSSNAYWNVIVLPVTKENIKRGINADHVGLFGFRGLWYNGNGTRIKSYGKIFDLSEESEIYLIRNDIRGLSKKTLRKILDTPTYGLNSES